MAKINNPQNQYGEDLATKTHVDTIVNEHLVPLKEQMSQVESAIDYNFTNITGNDYISISSENIKDNDGNPTHEYKTSIIPNVIEDIDTLDDLNDKKQLVSAQTVQKAVGLASIEIGRDADKNWSVDEQTIETVKKISFLGDYVNVVEVPGSNEVKLYIGENKSLEEADRAALDVTLPAESTVLLYNDDTDNYALKSGVTANSTSTSAVVVSDGTSYGSTKFTAKGGSFTTDQTDCIWVRTTYNYGTPSAWGKVQLNKNRGTYNRDTTTPTNSTVTPAAVTDVTLPSGVTMNVGNYILTAEDDAQYGKVPGRCETAYNFTVNWNTIATKGGGNIKVEWGLGTANEAGDAPSSAVTIKSYERYFTEKKSVAMDSVSASVTTPDYTSKVSGLEYLGQGTTVTVTTSNITNSQYKSAASTKRLNVTAGGTSVDYTTADLTLVSGTVTKSNAVYKLDASSSKSNVITLGSAGNSSATIKATPYGAAAGTERSATSVANFWGSIPTSTDTTENFGIEKTVTSGGYRMAKVTDAEGSYDNTAAIDAGKMIAEVPGTSHTGLVQAVCQYGSLKHPYDAAADGHNATPYKTNAIKAKDAVFIRKFKPTSDQTLVLKGTNIGKAKAVYWYDGKTYNLISTPVTGRYEKTNDQIKVTWSSAVHEPIVLGSRTVTIIVVMGQGNSAIGALTLA